MPHPFPFVCISLLSGTFFPLGAKEVGAQNDCLTGFITKVEDAPLLAYSAQLESGNCVSSDPLPAAVAHTAKPQKVLPEALRLPSYIFSSYRSLAIRRAEPAK